MVRCVLHPEYAICSDTCAIHILLARILHASELYSPCLQLVEGAEAKAYYGLTVNYGPLQALVERLLVKETMSGKDVEETLEAAGVVKFPDPFLKGFGWGSDGGLFYPGMPSKVGLIACSLII